MNDPAKILYRSTKNGLQEYIARQLKNGNLVRIKRKGITSSERMIPIVSGYESGTTSITTQKNNTIKTSKKSIPKLNASKPRSVRICRIESNSVIMNDPAKTLSFN